MKKLLCMLIVVLIAMSVVGCSSTDSGLSTKDEVQKTEYTISKDVKEGSVINGIMTDISGDDSVLTKTTASWLDTAVIYEVNIRQYTEEGTFSAFSDELDRLKKMGVNTLWLMPIHPISKTERKGTLGSYYAVSNYKYVNDEFGTIVDFKKLLNKAHDMGFKVILDWVANHTGWDHDWIKEHPDWYKHEKSGEISSPYDWTDTAQLDYDNYEMRAEMIRCMQFWVDDIGVDGFRCDHAIGVPSGFWNAAVYFLKSRNPELMFLAETSASEPLTKYAFDCCYNDNLYGQTRMVVGGASPSALYEGMVRDLRYSGNSFAMNYLDNHDKNSYDGSIDELYKDYYRPLLAVSFLAPGVPMIYTSDESGYDHCIEFFEKDTIDWSGGYKYADMIKTLSKLKAKTPALASTNSDIELIETNDNYVFVFTRTMGDSKVMFVCNFDEQEATDVSYTVPSGFENGAKCALHVNDMIFDSKGREVSANDLVIKTIQPLEFYIFTAE